MDKNTKKIVLGIVSFLIPIVGLILWLAKKSSEEDVAKTCGIAALVGFVLNLIIMAAA